MLNIGIVALVIIDFILLSFGKIITYMKAYKVLSIRDFANKIQSKLPKRFTEEEKTDEVAQDQLRANKKNLFQWIWFGFKKLVYFILESIAVVIVILFFVVLIVICIAIPTSSIWGTILFAVYKGYLYAVIFLIVSRTVNFLLGLWLLKRARVDKLKTQRILINDVIQFSMLLLLLYIAAFGYPIDINNLIIVPFQWDVVLNNLLSIIIPVVFYSVVITNVFALMVRFGNILTKDTVKHKVLRLHQLLFIFITSCFFGILYLTDNNFAFMSEFERTMYFETLDIFRWMITSVFIPLFLFTLNNFRKEHNIRKIPRKRTSGLQ